MVILKFFVCIMWFRFFILYWLGWFFYYCSKLEKKKIMYCFNVWIEKVRCFILLFVFEVFVVGCFDYVFVVVVV